MPQSIIDDIDTGLTGNATIKVFGVGGAGGNAIQKMIDADLVGVHFICANTDLQALSRNSAPTKIQLGEKLTKGLGAGANPSVGREAASESMNAIRDAIGESDMIFITAGLGGGTGTGAAPVVAQAAKEMGVLTVGVVTKPFTFEGPNRQRMAEDGLDELKKYVDCLIIVPNDRLFSIAPKKTPITQMFQKADEVLLNGVRGISDVIKREGFINVDFADVRTTMSKSGLALMGTGVASGENRAREATQMAIQSPLLENVSLESAKAVLYNITTSGNITMEEMGEIGYMIHESVHDDNINIIFGIVYDETMGDALQVTVIATGIEPMAAEEEQPAGVAATVTNFSKPRAQTQQSSSVRSFTPMPTQEEEEDAAHEEPVRPPRKKRETYDDRLARPAYTRSREGGSPSRSRHIPGQDSYSFDEEDYDVPTFLRKTAD